MTRTIFRGVISFFHNTRPLIFWDYFITDKLFFSMMWGVLHVHIEESVEINRLKIVDLQGKKEGI